MSEHAKSAPLPHSTCGESGALLSFEAGGLIVAFGAVAEQSGEERADGGDRHRDRCHQVDVPDRADGEQQHDQRCDHVDRDPFEYVVHLIGQERRLGRNGIRQVCGIGHGESP